MRLMQPTFYEPMLPMQELEDRYKVAVAGQEALAADITAAQRRVGQAQKVS